MSLKNYAVPIPASECVVYLGVWDSRPNEWLYSIWTGEGDDERLVCNDRLNLAGLGPVRPDQVARMAYLVDITYG